MWSIARKEWQTFFGNLTGYLAIALFLLLNGLYLFVFPESSLLNFGYASLQGFFSFAPWVLLLLAPVVTMRSFADEYRQHTFELLKTWPLKPAALVGGKMLGGLLVLVCSLLPTLVYALSLQALSVQPGLDTGATLGAYLGLLLIGGCFVALGVCASSFTASPMVAFLVGAAAALIFYAGFEAFASLPIWGGNPFWVETVGIKFHYASISRGVVDLRTLLYFGLLIGLAFFTTLHRLRQPMNQA